MSNADLADIWYYLQRTWQAGIFVGLCLAIVGLMLPGGEGLTAIGGGIAVLFAILCGIGNFVGSVMWE